MTPPPGLEYTGVDILETLQAAKNYNNYLADLVQSASGPSRTALDFGAGIGTFSQLMRARGYAVRCLETDVYLAERLRAARFQTDQNLADLGDGSIDFAFSLNVFEHIEDDLGVMRQLARKLRPGGRFMIYVPAFQSLWSSLDDKVHHHRRYTRPTLSRLVEEAGLTVAQSRYADSLGFPAALLYKLGGNKSGTLNAGPIAFYDRFAMPVSVALDRVTGRFVGKNVYAICTKR